MDINKLKKVRNTLRLQFGGGVPKYVKQIGDTTIYSNDGKIWYDDYINKIPTTIHQNIPEQTLSLNDINQFRTNSLNPSYITNLDNENNLPITDPLSYHAKLSQQSQSLIGINNNIASLSSTIEDPIVIPEKVEIPTPKISRSQSIKDQIAVQKDLKEKDPEEYEKQYGNLNKSLNQTVSTIGTAAQGIGQAVSVNQMMTDSNLTKGIDVGYDLVADGLSKLGPVGQIAGTAMKVLETLGDVGQEYLGTGTDQQSTLDKWMDSPLFSWNIGMVNGVAGKNSNSFTVNQDMISQIGGSYGGSVNDLNDASEKAGKKYGLLSWKSREKANAAIASAKHTQNMMSNISDIASDQRLAVQSMGEQAGLAYSLMTGGGYDQKYTYAAKHGGMLEWNPIIELEWKPQIELNWELSTFKNGGNIDLMKTFEWVPEFKDGGKTKESDIPEIEETTQKNVIPEGALHKNKHHMEHAEGLTKKGIPVIDENGEQQAEIEHSEIIFTLEVTKKLEEYYQIFYSEESSNKEKEQAAIDAGKLLVYQILENTDDRTNLIESCKDGGTLKLKKSTDDLIEEALEWIPQIVIIEEEVKKNSKDKSEKDDLKNQMKEALKEALIELITK